MKKKRARAAAKPARERAQAAPRGRPRRAGADELLARVDALGITDSEVERAAALPQAFLARARAGRNRHPRADDSWRRLVEALPSLEGRGRGGVTARAIRKVAAETKASDARATALLDAIRTARSYRALDDLVSLIQLAIVEDDLTPSQGGVLLDAAKERRQLLKAEEEQARRIDARKPVVVEVRFKGAWAEKLEANLRAEELEKSEKSEKSEAAGGQG